MAIELLSHTLTIPDWLPAALVALVALGAFLVTCGLLQDKIPSLKNASIGVVLVLAFIGAFAILRMVL